jgi:hypothetical protein
MTKERPFRLWFGQRAAAQGEASNPPCAITERNSFAARTSSSFGAAVLSNFIAKTGSGISSGAHSMYHAWLQSVQQYKEVENDNGGARVAVFSCSKYRGLSERPMKRKLRSQ